MKSLRGFAGAAVLILTVGVGLVSLMRLFAGLSSDGAGATIQYAALTALCFFIARSIWRTSWFEEATW